MHRSSDRTGPNVTGFLIGFVLLAIAGTVVTGLLAGLYMFLPQEAKTNPFMLTVAITMLIMAIFISAVWAVVNSKSPKDMVNHALLVRSSDAPYIP